MVIIRAYLVRYSSSVYRTCRYNSSSSSSSMSEKRGLVLGVYSTKKSDDVKFTPFAEKYNQQTEGELLKQINIAGPIKCGQTRIFWNLGQYPAVAVSGLGDGAADWDATDEINGVRENARIAASAGAKALLGNKITNIDVEDLNDPQSAAEGASLGVYKYQALKSCESQSPEAKICLAQGASNADEFNRGAVLAEAQNWARHLMETPANYMTPTEFARSVGEKVGALGVKVEAHDRAWAESKKMGSFLSVSAGSDQPPVFLELTYNGVNGSSPICLVGKGVTFDSGGISLKPGAQMDQMRADMGGAACVAATIYALAKLKVPVAVKGLIPLTENMPNGRATKPGDVVTAMNGKTICVDNTDAEGRLILCDALCYSAEFKPKFVLDIATLTGAIRVALGDCVAGVFTNCNNLWQHLHKSGSETGDRVWRMPLFKHYTKQMTDHDGYDLNNLGKGKGGGSCTAAAFLKEFAPKDTPWVHVDMAGVMGDCSDQSYTGAKGMTGRPMRTLFEFIVREAGIKK